MVLTMFEGADAGQRALGCGWFGYDHGVEVLVTEGGDGGAESLLGRLGSGFGGLI